ncbi:DUF802 domain-containing protein [Cupriavidus gilardii]|uniref:DUF802 domain-containing protein n=1 Tax=Cupriavidus gilardii TaxID=82541 RepID=UPI00158002FA|nr:DUF802 domain-containing protein [Cupriavidus gilardii]MCT9071863.1 DUF802 domain-containing protein [Cupriavidus gilardii]QKS63663.1 DUF802 domain-containing protein [Cupriavidus gilardii]
MTRFPIQLVVFLAGLLAVCWIGAGYAGSNALAFAVTLLIGGFYVGGAFELQRYRRATASLTQAVNGLSETPASLGAWLDRIDPGLRQAVRLRVEGERVSLPGPALTSYFVGLLVLLGMLGTFLGMVATLKGTGLALETATDLQAIRASLAAPVKGLGFAFGTSVAGVATSAMLGLLSALCRRERIDAAQALDAQIATTLRVHSRAHQREEAFRLMQSQAEAMPVLVDRLNAMMAAMEQQSQALTERLAASQDAFHGKTEAVYTRLAASVEQSLKDGVAESARAASAAIQPAVVATMSGLAREAAGLRDTVTQSMRQQLEGLASRFDATTTQAAGLWNEALADHRRTSAALADGLRGTLDGFAASFEQRSAGLLEQVAQRMDTAAEAVSARWNEAMSGQERTIGAIAAENQQALANAASAFERSASALLGTVAQAQAELRAQLAAQDEQRLANWSATLSSHERAIGAIATENQQALAAAAGAFEQNASALLATVARAQTELRAQLAAQDEQRLANWSATLSGHERAIGAIAAENQQALAAATGAFEQNASTLLTTVAQAQAELRAQLAAHDEQRLANWSATLDGIAAALRQQWEQTGAQTASRQQQICETLERTAHEITAQTQAQAASTIAEVARLAQVAGEAPRVAADAIAELRRKLSDEMARDNAMLEERTRLMESLSTLLEQVGRTSTAQREAVDTLVATSAELLERIGSRFTDKVEAETGKLTDVAAQVTGSAAEVASLGEAFGVAVQLFSESNDKLVAHLQRIEAALDKSMARSDEQLAYYVAQAREVVDLSMRSQKQILEDLQQVAGQRAPDAEAA